MLSRTGRNIQYVRGLRASKTGRLEGDEMQKMQTISYNCFIDHHNWQNTCWLHSTQNLLAHLPYFKNSKQPPWFCPISSHGLCFQWKLVLDVPLFQADTDLLYYLDVAADPCSSSIFDILNIDLHLLFPLIPFLLRFGCYSHLLFLPQSHWAFFRWISLIMWWLLFRN